jgi:hypothetical protein
MQGGARYQNQVTAWLAAKMLAERPAAPIISRGKLTYLAAESGEAVDDVLDGTDQGNFAFVQAKRRLSFSTRDGSELGPSAASYIIRFASDDQNTSAKCAAADRRPAPRADGDGCG